MFTRTRILTILPIVGLLVVSAPLLGAGDGGAGTTTAPGRAAGFFETHYVLTEMIVLPILALLLAGAMASNMTTERIETTHWDFWNKPLGRSYTDIPVNKEPSSPTEIKNTLIVLGVI